MDAPAGLHLGRPSSLLRHVAPTTAFVRFGATETEQSIAARFEQQVRLHPDRMAIMSGTQELTYAAFNRAANRIAHAILARKPRGGGHVALLCGHEGSVLAASFGALKAGTPYVTLDPGAPSARQSYILDHAEAGIILTDSELLQQAEALAGGRPVLDIGALEQGLPDENLERAIAADAIAYLVYTSGSTGQPKGVIESHRTVLHFAMNFTNACHIGSSDRVSLLVSYNFTAAATPTFGALLNGAALLPMDLKARGLVELPGWLIRERISVLHTVPTVFRRCLSGREGAAAFRDIRLICMGSEPLYASDVALYRRHFSDDCILVHDLGATERKGICRFFMDKRTEIAGPLVPVGYVVPGNEVRLLDEDGRAVGAGEVGEITVRSRYLSPGYWRQPQLSAATFRPDPHGGAERVYHTGDLGRMDADGCLSLLGRKDFQVKIRGQRVELGEVEAALRELPSVAEAIVVARDVAPDGKRLVTYFVPAPGQAPTAAELRAALRAWLPTSMLPTAFVRLDALPRTPTGKVDRLALPEPERLRPGLREAFIAPATPSERRLAEVWERLLGVRPIGVTDSFFDLGGDSLLAVQLFLEIDAAFGLDLPLTSLFPEATIEHLARLLGGDAPATPDSPLVLMRDGGGLPALFCVHAIDGETFSYKSLLRHLPPDRPVYGLRVHGLEDTIARFTSLEELAAFHIAAVRSAQPSGPYHLLGYSLGGPLAFEMARQLEAAGQRVGLVANIDHALCGLIYAKFRWRPGYLAGLLAELLTMSRRLRDLPPNLRAAHLRQEAHSVLDLCAKGARRHLRFAPPTLDEPSASAAQAADLDFLAMPPVFRRVASLLHELRAGYTPRPYHGYLTIFRASVRPLLDTAYHDLGWGGLAARIDVHVVPGLHLTILRDPYVAVLATQLQACLAVADADGGREAALASAVVNAQPLA